MGDISIIARRLSDQYVQYGWSGNGGYFSTVGARLLAWYDSPEMVEYLFGLGQLRHLWAPHSEQATSGFFRTQQDGLPHWVDSSERYIFSKIAFVDFGYFYDADQQWYYVIPGPFRIKLPLTLVAANLDNKDCESPFIDQIEKLVVNEIFSDRHIKNLERSGHSEKSLKMIQKDLDQKHSPLDRLWEEHRSVFNCFDDWVLVRPDAHGKNVGEIILQPNTEQHIETIFW